jgi:hypothetical protein
MVPGGSGGDGTEGVERVSKLGTCKHTYQIQEMWTIRLNPQPHEVLEEYHPSPERYTCQWLDQFGELPPTIKRRNGGFEVRGTDCDECVHYAPAIYQTSMLPNFRKGEPE